MIVTFVSQCEKKALKRTRRILDAFANRIGNRAWQTVITEEGLKAVKQLLRKAASKNSAVSCHRLRSRVRSELEWIVGNRDKFNFQGLVPVNYTEKELFMDEVDTMTVKTYANTKAQLLNQHLFAVGCIAHQIIEIQTADEKLAKSTFIGGCLHDLGKLDPGFQKWLVGELKTKSKKEIPEEGQHIEKRTGKFSFESHPRHNEISLLLFHLLSDFEDVNSRNKKTIRHVLYWHHAKPVRKDDFRNLETIYKKLKNNLTSSELSTLIQAINPIMEAIDKIGEHYYKNPLITLSNCFFSKIDDDRLYDLGDTRLPEYKKYSDANEDLGDYQGNINENARNSLARAAVVTADRLVSSLTPAALSSHIENRTLHQLLEAALLKERGLKAGIQACLDRFEEKFPGSERNKQQSSAATRLSDEEVHVAVLKGPAGCGKTKIALEWALKTEVKKIIWICPRVQICQGLLNDLTSNDYLPDTTIEINTGEFKYFCKSGQRTETPEGKEFSGDIILTTIDQITNTIITHRHLTTLVAYMDAHIVFDEFHEYINMPGFNLLFAELVQCKRLQKTSARTLLVSATPNDFFIKEFLEIAREDVIGIKSFNQSQYRICFQEFDESESDGQNPLYRKYEKVKQTIVISNTAITAQNSFILNQNGETALLFHSKFKKSDKELLFANIFESFGEKGNSQAQILRSGPIVQASLNITCEQMITEFTNPENWLQRLGRLDRFGKNREVNSYITAVPRTLAEGKQSGSCAKFLNSLNILQSAKAWHEYLGSKLGDIPVRIEDIYRLYDEFYECDSYHNAIESDLKKSLKKGVDVVHNKVLDPIFFVPKKIKKSEQKVKIKNSSLRGDNRFVQMALCKITTPVSLDFLNEYAYPEAETDNNLTAPVDLITGSRQGRNSDKDLLAFMKNKHHNIKKEQGAKKAYNNLVLLNMARNPENPIYLSYTPGDLEIVESQPHPHAIYYAIGVNQPIGSISIDRIIKTGEENGKDNRN